MRDVVVVGGGAAGLSAALTLARARRRVTVVDAGAPRNAPADGVHGLLALDGLNPVELLARGRAEVTGYGCEIIAAEVSDVSCTSLGFAVMMRDGGVSHARRLAVASRMFARADVFARIGLKPTPHLMGSYIAADPTGRTPVCLACGLPETPPICPLRSARPPRTARAPRRTSTPTSSPGTPTVLSPGSRTPR
jgi:alkyl hydroperoxide reductase subunit AhpF